MEKGYLYVGHYIDTEGNYILKIGTTTRTPKERGYEHNQYYRKKLTKHIMPKEEKFVYDWCKEFAQSNIEKYESKTRNAWKELNLGEYLPKDRFACDKKPEFVEITIRKTYRIYL
jgi:hypothetical protein